MCFSSTASFVAAGGLAATGSASVAAAWRRPRLLPLAAVPLLFALQQISEGMLWRVLSASSWGKSDTSLAQVFLFFALFVWPAYVPTALLVAEDGAVSSAGRRQTLKALAAVGCVLGAYLMACSALRPSYSCIAYGNLYYAVAVDAPLKPLAPFLYVAVILGSFGASSLRGTSTLAGATALSFFAAGSLYRVGFASVWCFFAALLSMMVCAILLVARREPRPAARLALPERQR